MLTYYNSWLTLTWKVLRMRIKMSTFYQDHLNQLEFTLRMLFSAHYNNTALLSLEFLPAFCLIKCQSPWVRTIQRYEVSSFSNTRKAKAASGRFSFERGYNQTCHYYQNLHTDIPKLHAKFHQNPWCGFGEKCGQDNDIV